MRENKTKYTTLMGDFNAKVRRRSNEESDIVGPHTYGDRNERGDRLIAYANKENLIISKHLFQEEQSKILDMGKSKWAKRKSD